MFLEKLKKFVKDKPFLKELLIRIYTPIKILKNHPSRFSLIRKALKTRKAFIVRENELIQHKENSLLQNQYFFIPQLLKKVGLEQLFKLILNKKYGRVAIIGDHFNKRKIIQALQIKFPKLIIHSFTHPGKITEPFDIQFYPVALILTYHQNAIPLIRTVLNTLQFPGDLILESKRAKRPLPIQTNESAKPIVVCAYPCAGTNRFIFGFEYLMNKLSWEIHYFVPFIRNIRYIHTLKQKNPDDELVDQAFYWRIQTLDYFQWLNTHEYFSLEKVKDSDCRFVVLMRDPRDIINCFYWHTINEISDKKNHIHRVIDGYSRFSESNYAFNWPNVNKIMDNYLVALENDHFYIIRFEDLHQDNIRAFKKLMIDLKLYPHPFLEIGEKDFNYAAYLGSFEFQTQGKRKRGEHNDYPPNNTRCRKGIIGDWRSSFTEKAVEHFKSLTGDKLVKLGYEKTMDWDL